MTFVSRLVERDRRMSAMAEQNGADLDVAMLSGVLTPEEVQAAGTLCTACTQPEECGERLAAGTAGLPDYCLNAELFRSVSQIIG